MSREDDKRVAEILGWTFWSEQRGEYCLHFVWPAGKEPPYERSRDWEVQKDRYQKLTREELKDGNWANRNTLPRFTTDPAADYKVLEFARGLDRGVFQEFCFMLVDFDREDSWEYMPGDYSRALLALDERGLLK